MNVDYSDFSDFEGNTDGYLPFYGEGKNMAEQLVTALTKLVYKWFNDGDIPDNQSCLDGWCNDLSSYANWIARYIPEAEGFYVDFTECHDEQAYTELLYSLEEKLFTKEILKKYEKFEKVGSVYKCDGSFTWEERNDDDEDDWN